MEQWRQKSDFGFTLADGMEESPQRASLDSEAVVLNLCADELAAALVGQKEGGDGNSTPASAAPEGGQPESGSVAEVDTAAILASAWVDPKDCYNCGGLRNTRPILCERCSGLYDFTPEGRMIAKRKAAALVGHKEGE